MIHSINFLEKIYLIGLYPDSDPFVEFGIIIDIKISIYNEIIIF